MFRILLVDDEPDILAALEVALPFFFGGDLQVDTAANGREARQRLDAAAYDAVLSDERMPEMTGLELFDWVAAHHPGSLRVLMTAYAEGAATQDASGDGRVHFLVKKPIHVAELAVHLRNWLRVHPQVASARRN